MAELDKQFMAGGGGGIGRPSEEKKSKIATTAEGDKKRLSERVNTVSMKKQTISSSKQQEKIKQEYNNGNRATQEKNKLNLQNYRSELSQDNMKKNAEIWNEHFHSRPEEVFSESGFNYLETLSMGQRLAILRFTSDDNRVIPDMMRQYFEKFPGDINVLADNYEIYGVNNRDDFMITTLLAPSLVKYKPYLGSDLGRYLEIAERRSLMPDVLMDNLNYQEGKIFFGGAIKEYGKVFSDAAQLDMAGDEFLDMSRLFGKEFDALSQDNKEKFLRFCVADLHNSLVITEVYNGVFVKKRVKEDKQRVKNIKFSSYNTAHSMIFKTYQPSSSYELAQDFFQRDMDSTFMYGGFIEEYPFHRMLLKTLGQFNKNNTNKEKNVDVLVDFWNKNRNPIFANLVIEALNSQDPNAAAQKLLEILRNDYTEQKNAIAAILYRLEFGRIGISEKGVRYLEKMYDLGEMNNPDYFVKRLTGNGDIGVFDDERVLLGYFNIKEGLDSDEDIIKTNVMDFTYETLFFAKEGETEEDRQERKKYLQEFKENYFDFYDDEFVEKTGTRFNDLDFKEQGQFLIYYKRADEQQRERLLQFVLQYKEMGLKTFLSIEQGGEDMGEKILQIGDAFEDSPELAMQIFAQYVSMVDSIDSQVEEMSEMYESMFYKKSISKEQLVEKILKDSTNVLLQVNDDIRDVKDVIQKREIVQNLIIDLKRIDDVNKKNIQNVTEVYKKLDDLKKDFIYTFAKKDEISLLNQVLGNPEKYSSPQELNKAVESGEIETWWMDAKWRQVDAVKKEINYIASKIDSHVINSVTNALKAEIDENEEYLRRGLDTPDYESYYKQMLLEGKQNQLDMITFKRYMYNIFENKKQIKKMEEMLELQDNFEKLFDGIVYGDDKQVFENSSISARVMQKYQELIEEAKRSKNEIEELFAGEAELTDEELNNISGNMIKKARDLLDDFIEQINTTENTDESIILQKLDRMRSDIELFKITTKNARRLGLIRTIEDMKNISISTKKGKEVLQDNEFMSQAKKIIMNNQKHETEQLREELYEEFVNNLDNENSEVHIMNYKEDVAAFLVVEKNDNVIHASGFNADIRFQEVAPGAVMMNSVIDTYAQEGFIIKAEAEPSRARVYIGKRNFVAVGAEEFAGKKFLLLERDDSQEYQTKQISRKDIYNLNIENLGKSVDVFVTNIEDQFPPQLDEGYKATQFIANKKQGKYYYLLEKAE